MNKLKDRIAVITGASRGLGRETALRLAADGATVVVHYGRNGGQAAEVAGAIRALGGRALTVGGNLSSVEGVRQFYADLDAALIAETGAARFDVLVANAGVNEAVPAEATSEASFDRLFDTNVKGVFFLLQEGVERLRDGGRIITLSSGLTRFVYPQYAAYAMTKGAIEQLTRTLAKTLGPRGITVNSVAPGAIDTDLNAAWLRDNPSAQEHLSGVAALGRVGQPDDVADVIAFIASDASRWVTAQRIEASGGAHL